MKIFKFPIQLIRNQHCSQARLIHVQGITGEGRREDLFVSPFSFLLCSLSVKAVDYFSNSLYSFNHLTTFGLVPRKRSKSATEIVTLAVLRLG